MLYKFKDEKVITKSVEYSVAYHCNLRCSACSHLAPFQKKRFPAIEEFSSDINQLSKNLHAHVIRLLGGEPLLNPEINSFIKIAKESGIADKVMVTTNGLLLHKMDNLFWETVDYVLVSLYPGIQLKEKIESLNRCARKFKTQLWVHSLKEFKSTIVTRPHPKDWLTKRIFASCKDVHIFHCHMIHEGKLYKCAVPPFLPEYLSKMGINEYDPVWDSFNIYGGENVFSDLKDFLLSPEPLEACRYCLGSLGENIEHQQLKKKYVSDPSLLNITRDNYFDQNKLVDDLLACF